jgi:hypothetical protein
MTRLLVEFGMSPSSRSRVIQAAPEEHRELVRHDDDERDPREFLRALK